MPRFSFIIPVYNSGEYIQKCIESIIDVSRFTDIDFEIVLIDDGSSQESNEIPDMLSACDTGRIIVIHQYNNGVSAARNVGLRYSVGEYVIFIDSDDTIDTGKMSECMKLIAQNVNIDMLIYGMSFDYYHKKRCYRTDCMLPPYSGEKTISECINSIDMLFASNSLSSLCNKIIKREVLARNNLTLDEQMFLFEDLDFSLRALRCCDTVFFFQNVVYHYRQFENHSNRFKRLSSATEITDIIGNDLEQLGCDKSKIIQSMTSFLNGSIINYLSAKEVMEKYPNEAVRMLTRRWYCGFRHKVANFVKRTIGDFRKW